MLDDPAQLMALATARSGAANGAEEQLLLEVRRKIHPRSVTGVFARWRWIMVWATQLVFYGLPWLQWNDRQAVLFDLGARRFHIFGLVLHPQDFIYLTALLVVSAMSLFLFTTVAGRLWCGYACPQTVYTEIFMWIERRIEGDRNRRIKLDAAPWSARKWRIKATKHVAWVVVALWTGITFVGYFTPIRVLLPSLATFSLGPWQTFWVLFYGFATWGNAGFMREQVCKYMCPYARFQGVMVDRDTLVITYDEARGEPRGKEASKKHALARAAVGRSAQATIGFTDRLNGSTSTGAETPAAGDCVDCSLCVQVCPTGIDIRDGQQYECIGCAACIDVCNQVMDKVGAPRGLIRYDTLNGVEQGLDRDTLIRRVLRPRVLLYTSILVLVISLLGLSLYVRVPLKVDVMRDRGALSREVKNGVIENVYRVMIANTSEIARTFTLSVHGLETLAVDSESEVALEASGHRLIAVRVRAEPDAGEPGSHPIIFEVRAVDDDEIVKREKASFYLPEPL